jgi:hypothetical protein
MRKQAFSIFALTGLFILGGVGWLSFGYQLPLGESPWSLFLSILVLSLTGLGLGFLRILARRHGFARQGLVLSVALAIGMLWALPNLVAPCSPPVAAVSAGGVNCDQCCTWWVPAPCSLCSQADYNAGKCLGCCLRYEACNCETPEPDPDTPTPLPPTRTPTSTPTRTPTVTPTFTPTFTLTPTKTSTPTFTSTPTQTSTPTFTATPTFTPTPTNTATPTPTPLPPTVSGTLSCSRWGRDGWCMGGAQLVLSASDPQGFPLVIFGHAGNVPISCGASCIVNLPEGSGMAEFTVTSSSGRTDSGSLPWKYDASLPKAVVQKNGIVGVGGWYVSAANVSGMGSDAVSGVAAVEVSINSGAWQPATVSLPDGIFQVQARVIDLAGWSALSPVQTVRVDTTQPGLTMTASGTKGGGDYFRSAVTVSLVAEDAGSGVALVEYRLDGRDWVVGSTVSITANGAHGLEGRVTDQAGNVSLRVMAVHIDTIPPVATFMMPAPGSTTPGRGVVGLGGKVSDVGSGVAGVELSLDNGKTWQALTLVNEIWRYYWYTPTLPNGSYPVVVRARDIAGNVQSPGTAAIILVANHPPLVDVQERWHIWESGSVSVRENGDVPVDGVRVTIRDPLGRWPAVVQEYSSRNLPGSIAWNRRFGDGTLAPSGEYEVVVEAWDGYGNEASDKGVIVIPFVAGATVTTTPVVPPSPSPTVANKTSTPTKVVTPTQIVMPTTVPTTQPTLEPVLEQPDKSLSFWPVVGLLGMMLALASAAVADGRPRALACMKETFNQIMKNQGE